MVLGHGALAVWQAEAESSQKTAGAEVPTRENVDDSLKWSFQLSSPVLPLELGEVMVGSRQALPATPFAKSTAQCK